MIQSVATLVSVTTAIAGVYYLLRPIAEDDAADFEEGRLQVRRVRYRRVGGAAMTGLGILLYVGTHMPDAAERPRVFLNVWLGVLALLGMIVILALVDLRITLRLRSQRRRQIDET